MLQQRLENMDLIPNEEIYKYKKKSKYKEEFNFKSKVGLYSWLREVLKTNEHAVLKEDYIKKWLEINESTKIDSIYRRIREILKNSDMGVKIGKHLDGDRVLVFYWKY